MSVSGALFDMIKLQDVSKIVISNFTAKKVYNESLKWANKYDSELKEMLENDEEYSLRVLGIERGNVKPRKDIAKWSDVKNEIYYMYSDKFEKMEKEYPWQNINDMSKIKEIVSEYINVYDENDDKQEWFNKIKDVAEKCGYAREVKEYKANPDNYPGHVGDVSTVIRIVLADRTNTPDMYEIMHVLGKQEVINRLNKVL
jgi:glutamyl-tRNA synthetase